jgi:hypothetical protein
MDEVVTTNWPKWCLVEVKGPLENFPGTDPRVESGLSEEIEGKFSLWEKKVPKVRWKGQINSGQDCQEVVLECANGALYPIAAMHVWRDKLEGGVPLGDGCFFTSRAGFVITDLEITREPTGCQTNHDCVVGCDEVVVTLVLKGLLEDEFAISIKVNHDILVAGESSDREAARVVGEELAEGFCYKENLVERHCNRRWQNR